MSPAKGVQRPRGLAGAVVVLLALVATLTGVADGFDGGLLDWGAWTPQAQEGLEELPQWDGEHAFVQVGDGVPSFTDAERGADTFESYAPLDSLGRCGAAFALVGPETMPTEPRGDISRVKPSGWNQAFYDFVDGEALYNRCHLVAYSLAAENDNEQNLICGTRYLNVRGMKPFEDQVACYIDDTGNHVLYRVTPVFEGNNLVASGVRMEAESVEDGGRGVRFDVYCPNVQPGVQIDYATGESWATDAG